METKRFTWLDREFLELSGETHAGSSVEETTGDLLRRFEEELRGQKFSLDNAARITVFGRNRAARTAATLARGKVFSGRTRVGSSSFISTDRFDSQGDAALELLLLKPPTTGALREPVDFSPARNYLRFLRYDGWLFSSGFTSEAETLELQIPEVLNTLEGSFAAGGTEWSKVVKLTIFLQRNYDWDVVRGKLPVDRMRKDVALECRFVDGFAGEKYLMEIEATTST